MSKNYYLVLGISADASTEDIKAAFRRRARELHPDRSGRESGPFQDAQEAYSGPWPTRSDGANTTTNTGCPICAHMRRGV